MRIARTFPLVCLIAAAVWGQTDRGTLTGLISDPAGAVVPNGAVEVRNMATGALFQGGSSATGNYVFSLPRGTYELSVTVPGFKRFVRANIEVPVATTVNVDVTLEVGAATESITVTDLTPLLKTESGDISYNVRSDRANVLPILTIGTSANAFGAIRNPLQVVQLLPGTQFADNLNLRVNGLPSNTGTIRVEGQDASNGLWRQQNTQLQQGMEAIEEVAIQTSNYAAEYGQAAGGYFNFTMKSGTNQFHGSAYDYYVNEVLNAGLPHTDAGQTNSRRAGEHVRNRQRRNDYGFTIGGPIWIPRLYDGHDRTFFFFNFEQFRETRTISNALQTVPTLAYREGDFSTAVPTCTTTAASCLGGQTHVLQSGQPARDSLGRNIPVQGVYDPATTRTLADGSFVRDLFPGMKVPVTRFDRVTLAVQNMLPLPTNTALFNNYLVPTYRSPKTTDIPSVKIDHNLSPTIKLSGYVSRTLTEQPNYNGLDPVLTAIAAANNRSTTTRINYDQTLAPTVLLHIGVGYLYLRNPQLPARFDQSTIGLTGFYSDTFPQFTVGTNGTQGGVSIPIGAGFNNYVQWDQKPTANINVTWVKNNHTYKFGGEMIVEGLPVYLDVRSNGQFGISQNQTRNLWENGQPGLTGQSGFSYASFLLGEANSLTTTPRSNMKLGNHAISWFAQDTWKVTRKFTLDYGLRYDFQTYLQEQYGRMQSADFDTVNKKVNYTGTVRYEGYLPGQCQCQFSKNYKVAFGPRLGAAYQIDAKTVLRAGTALTYGTASNNSFLSLSIADFYTINAPGFGQNALPEGVQAGNPYRVGNPYGNTPFVFPNFDPDKYPTRTVCPGTANQSCFNPQSPFIEIDRDSRPPRIFQYSVSLQREVMQNLVVEVAYVGNRGVWFTAPALATRNYNTLTFDSLRQYGLDINSAADRQLLVTPLGSQFTGLLTPAIAQRGFQLPYRGYPITQNLTNSLIPRPHWGLTIPPFLGPPLGKTWYDSLQVTATKRYSHGLDMQVAFTYGKELALGANSDSGYLGTPANSRINDVFNRNINKQWSPLSRPYQLVISGNYTTPGFAASSTAMRIASLVARDWVVGLVFRYQSGQILAMPNSNNQLFAQLSRGGGLFGGADTFYNFAPGKGPGDIFLKDPNCGCFDPTKDLVLDASAFQDAPPGQFATTAAYYNEYRWQRQPQENASIGRNFRFGRENRFNLNVRAEFQNVFNRRFYSAPSSGNPNTVVQYNNPFVPGTTGTGALSQGFGFVNYINGAGANPRTGLLVARFTF
jgi:hypothetical protein